MLQARAAECDDLWRELGIEIPRREGEPRAVADLWKFASATGRGACRATDAIGFGGRNAASGRATR